MVADSLLRLNQLKDRIGLSSSTIYDRLNPKSPRHDPDFPRPVKCGLRATRWLASEVDAYIEHCVTNTRRVAA